jgi:N-acetylglucosamine kinase-like BadF-type ATPase
MEKRNILIADSGSTKTDWAILTSAPQPVVLNTQGINPVHQSREEVVSIIRDEFLGSMASNPDVQRLRSASVLTPDFPDAVYFYGSGVRPEMEAMMVALLREIFHTTEVVEAHSDLLGAARALCGRQEGIACILGTGANSCLYDGKSIAQHTPALGYILGDEGSGSVLGRRFLNAIFKNPAFADIRDEYLKVSKTTQADIIRKVYN